MNRSTGKNTERKPVAFQDVVKRLLDTPPSPKTNKSKTKRKNKT